MDPIAIGRWLANIDEACAYMGGVSRKTAYAWVAAGLRVARVGDGEARRDSRGRLWQGRIVFNTAWIDDFLLARASGEPLAQRVVDAGKSLPPLDNRASDPDQTATRLQRTAESEVASCRQ